MSLTAHLLAFTLPYWLPVSLLLFGSGMARRVGIRATFGLLALAYAFLVFYGDMILGKDQSVQMFMAVVGGLCGLCLGLALRKRAAPQ